MNSTNVDYVKLFRLDNLFQEYTAAKENRDAIYKKIISFDKKDESDDYRTLTEEFQKALGKYHALSEKIGFNDENNFLVDYLYFRWKEANNVK